MNRALKVRLVSFGLAIATLAILVGWAAYASWREVGKLQTLLSTGQMRSFEIADHLQAAVLDLNNSLALYAVERNPTDWQQFNQSSGALSTWIEQQKPLVASERERKVLDDINRAFISFLADASHNAAGTNQTGYIRSMHDSSERVWKLGADLADAHRDVLERYLADSRSSVLVLRWVIMGSLLLLLTSLGWLSVTVYREMITPLQMKLVESHAIIERQEKLASLGVLAAGVAHEIRNPLTAIKARLFSHQRTLDKGSPEFLNVLVIGTEINRLEQIVRDFLLFARPSEPRLAVMTAEQPLREVRDLLGPDLQKQSIDLVVQTSSSARFEADPLQLKQVLINLVQNAAESIEHDGRITLRARAGMASLGGELKPVVILETEDTGKGIPVEVRKRLFDPFFSTKENGTGLGLALSARIIEKHGGALEFQTQINRGTTFGIVLPICHGHA